MTDHDHEALCQAVGEGGWLAGDDVGPRYFTDRRGTGRDRPALVLRPATTAALSAVMRLCHQGGQPVVPQGGMTGLVAGARPEPGEIVVSMERMNAVEEIDPRTSTMTVQAGVALQTVQEQAEAHGLLFPLDLGSRGSCTVGGNLSTNAGGNRVIRYGMTRDLVLGLEAVLADGTVVSSMNRFIKNNTGYDLKQLFIGSEGTLGLITRAVLRLHRRPKSQVVAFCAVPDFDAVVGFMHHMQSAEGGTLSAFEVLWQPMYRAIVENLPAVRAPLGPDHPFYVLTEIMGGDQGRDQERFEATLAAALEAGLVSDAVVSQSHAEIGQLWSLRDGMAEAMALLRPTSSFDISLSIGDMDRFAREVQGRLTRIWNDARSFVGGHLGDGNLHVVATVGGRDPHPGERIEDIVYGLVGELGGSISAEHGIGMSKRRHLAQSRSPAEIALMRTLKQALDPKGILNPGRILAADG